MIFETLNESNERGELLLVLHGMCHYHLRRDGQLTIREIIVQKGHQGHGIGRAMLQKLEALGLEVGATSIFAKCPVELAANGWYERVGFALEGTETTRSGRTLNLWRLNLSGVNEGDGMPYYDETLGCTVCGLKGNSHEYVEDCLFALREEVKSLREELAELKHPADEPETGAPPDELWLQWEGDGDGNYLWPSDVDRACVTWSSHQVWPNDVRYILAEAGADGRGVSQLLAEKDAAYAERNRLVAALSKCFPAHLCRHEGAEWEDDWRNIVCVHLPTGQATWHVHDSEVDLFEHLPMSKSHWDGHTTEEKYVRLAALRPSVAEFIRESPMDVGQRVWPGSGRP